MDLDAYYEPIILVKRGDELPKKNFEKKLHPTYEVYLYFENFNNICNVKILYSSS